VKNIGKPCALIAHARFDEGGQAKACSLLYPIVPKWFQLGKAARATGVPNGAKLRRRNRSAQEHFYGGEWRVIA
jgi:hypothetical protein